MNKLEIKGDWNIAKGKIKQKWAQLTDEDLQFVVGKEEELIGRIQRRTGQAREMVERALHEACGSAPEHKWEPEKSMPGYANNPAHADPNDLGTLAEDARALLTATADVAGDKVAEARKRLAAALESGKEIYGRVRDKAVEGAKTADQAVREAARDRPYQALGLALGIGALIGYLAGRRGSRDRD